MTAPGSIAPQLHSSGLTSKTHLRVAVPEDPLRGHRAVLHQAGEVQVVSLLQVDVGSTQNFSNWF